MTGKFQLKSGIYEPSSDIPLNWSDMRTYYFLMKVGDSNCFLSKTESLGGFWVSFSKEDIPKFNKDTDCPIDLTYPDLHFLSLFSSKRWRKKVRILTFSTNELIIWKIEDNLTYLSKVNRPKPEILSILKDENNFKAVSSKTKNTLFSELTDENKYSKLKLTPSQLYKNCFRALK